ncbi:MAG: hypothetical protein ACJ8AW_31710, partial [Rhodopila sp.]
MQPRLATETIHSVLDCVRQLLSQSDIGTVYCTIYLVAQSHSADWAADAGWHALELGCDDDSVIIALADVLRLQTSPRQNPVSLMQERAREHRSTAFFIKLADHYVVSGQAYLAEDMLRDLVGRGRMDLMIRWAELWFELREWRSARSLLKQLPGDQMTAYTAYLTARCAVSLLLEDEVIQGAEALLSMPDPAPRFAALLRSIWA